ncbi:MAG: UPF0236 family protein [Spiroplasma sp.]|nr:UPF0236 family protein [Spiroplasma sp.]
MRSIVENHITYYETKNADLFKYALLNLKQEYENKDQEIFNSTWRKEKGYIPHGIRQRTLITIFGKLTYKRHRYLIWNKGRYRFIYLADIALGVKKYQRITTHLQIKILSLIAKGKRYQDILDCFPLSNITTNTITNIINRMKIDSLEDIIIKKVKPIKLDQYLYINIDDTFLNLKENNKKQQYRVRVILFHTGYDLEKSRANKKILKNSRIFFFLKKKNEQYNNHLMVQKIQKIAQVFYSNVNQAKIIISGDGATWIRNYQKKWPNSIYILDRFHTIRKIRQLFNPNSKIMQPIYENLRTSFFNGNYQEMVKILSKPWFQDKYKTSKLQELKYYLKQNEKNYGISNQKYDFNIGCNIESTISHHIKWLLGYGSKAFSKNIYHKILTLHIANVNNINTTDLLKEDFIKKLTLNWHIIWQKNN